MQDLRFSIPCGGAIVLMILTLGWIHLVPMVAVSDSLDMIVTKSPIAIFMLTWLGVGNMFLRTREDRQKVHRWVGLGLAVLVLMPNFYGGFARGSVRAKVKWHCNGVVTTKYRSHNHNVASVTVAGVDPARIEGVDEKFYELVNVGDTLMKDEWTTFAVLNGQPTRIVWRGWCRGPKCKGIP